MNVPSLKPLIPLALVVLLTSCTDSTKPADVEPARAGEALKTALEAWKKGAKPQSLSEGASPITAQDADWQAGAKLVDYAIDGEGTSVGPNQNIPVSLTLKLKTGKEAKKKVTYVVGTSPSVTVFRSMFEAN